MADEMTPAELGRALARVEAELAKIDGKLDGLSDRFVTSQLFGLVKLQIDARQDRVEARIDAAEKKAADDRRLIFTALVAPLIVAVIAALIIAQLVGG